MWQVLFMIYKAKILNSSFFRITLFGYITFQCLYNQFSIKADSFALKHPCSEIERKSYQIFGSLFRYLLCTVVIWIRCLNKHFTRLSLELLIEPLSNTFERLIFGEIATTGTRISAGVAPPWPPTSAIPWSPRTKINGGNSSSPESFDFSKRISLMFWMIRPISSNFGPTRGLEGPAKCPMWSRPKKWRIVKSQSDRRKKSSVKWRLTFWSTYGGNK